MHNLFGRECFLSRSFRSLFQLSSGFRSSPPSAFGSCPASHHAFILCPCNSHHDSGAVVAKSAASIIPFNRATTPKVSGLKVCRAVVCEPSVSAVGQPAQICCERLLRFYRGADRFVRQPDVVLHVKGSKGCGDIWPDTYNALLYSWPK